MRASLLDEWQHWYGDLPPLAYALREAVPERWLRIHVLHRSKRYATTAAEHAEVLRRLNAGGDELLGKGAPIAFFFHAGCSTRDLDHQAHHAGLTFPLTPVTQVVPDETDDEPLCISGARGKWYAGSFDHFLLAAADDKVAALLLAIQSGQVFAPYDGGADLIFATAVARDRARARFVDWLSDREDGL